MAPVQSLMKVFDFLSVRNEKDSKEAAPKGPDLDRVDQRLPQVLYSLMGLREWMANSEDHELPPEQYRIRHVTDINTLPS